MQLSILLPTHRHDMLACSRVMQVCSWAGLNLEVIVRDNSGNAQKQELLARFQSEHCRIVATEPCGPLENLSELLRMAKGDFVYCLADDDFCFDRAIAALPGVLEQCGKDPSIVGVTGAYAIESSKGSSVVGYQNVESDDVVARVAGYLSFSGANVLAYSPVRRTVFERVFAFMNAMQYCFSFHDQICCLLYLLNGKFARLPRLLYLYDFGVWEDAEAAQRRDVDFYRAAGFDPSINKLHWFLCGFEGAALTLNSDMVSGVSPAQRQSIADRWFSMMFVRFQDHPRFVFESRFARQADQLRAKLRTSAGQLSFQAMLMEISGFIALFSQSRAQSYFDFWNAVINKGQPVPPLRRAGAAT